MKNLEISFAMLPGETKIVNLKAAGQPIAETRRPAAPRMKPDVLEELQGDPVTEDRKARLGRGSAVI